MMDLLVTEDKLFKVSRRLIGKIKQHQKEKKSPQKPGFGCSFAGCVKWDLGDYRACKHLLTKAVTPPLCHLVFRLLLWRGH